MVPVFIRRRLRKYFGSLTPKQRKDDKAHKMSVSGTLIAHTVIAVGSTGKWKPTHLTKTDRQLFSALGLKPISSGKAVLGCLDKVCAPTAQEPGPE